MAGGLQATKTPHDKDGNFVRPPAVFRNKISSEPGAEFAPERDRYHLYVSHACPWAHRAMIVRKLKGLEEILPATSVHWHMDIESGLGWRFAQPTETDPSLLMTPDPHHPSFTHIKDIYHSVDANFSARASVPVLYDKLNHKIVSNESAEIIRMLYTEFDPLLPADSKYREFDLLPKDLEKEIDEVNEWMYADVNNGVYKAGVAGTQEAYERAVTNLFASLDRIEAHLAAQSVHGPYYFGARLTEADIRLYPTIIRFDAVYVQHFKCNLRDIRSGYPAIHRWVRNLYWNVEGFGETTHFEYFKKHYTLSHKMINPNGITPLGPVPDILPLEEEVRAVKAAEYKRVYLDGEANGKAK